MNFTIFYDKQPEKFLDKCDKHLAKRIFEKIEKLSGNPIPQDAKAIVGAHGVFRLRIGYHRVLYRVDYTNRKIIVFKIGKRDEVYR